MVDMPIYTMFITSIPRIMPGLTVNKHTGLTINMHTVLTVNMHTGLTVNIHTLLTVNIHTNRPHVSHVTHTLSQHFLTTGVSNKQHGGERPGLSLNPFCLRDHVGHSPDRYHQIVVIRSGNPDSAGVVKDIIIWKPRGQGYKC